VQLRSAHAVAAAATGRLHCSAAAVLTAATRSCTPALYARECSRLLDVALHPGADAERLASSGGTQRAAGIDGRAGCKRHSRRQRPPLLAARPQVQRAQGRRHGQHRRSERRERTVLCRTDHHLLAVVQQFSVTTASSSVVRMFEHPSQEPVKGGWRLWQARYVNVVAYRCAALAALAALAVQTSTRSAADVNRSCRAGRRGDSHRLHSSPPPRRGDTAAAARVSAQARCLPAWWLRATAGRCGRCC